MACARNLQWCRQTAALGLTLAAWNLGDLAAQGGDGLSAPCMSCLSGAVQTDHTCWVLRLQVTALAAQNVELKGALAEADAARTLLAAQVTS
jgi:hypothetical protein